MSMVVGGDTIIQGKIYWRELFEWVDSVLRDMRVGVQIF